MFKHGKACKRFTANSTFPGLLIASRTRVSTANISS
eukprot:10500.XXX_179029_179136_1 [CDS] Oithona nana genome sequencing.